jgi:hypothetical protein
VTTTLGFDPQVIGLGALIGLLVAFTGAGGGSLAVPLLVFSMHLRMAEAAPVSLMAVGLSSMLGAVLGLREGIVRYRAAALMGAVGLVVAPLGVALAQRVPNAPLQGIFAAVLGIVAWRMWGVTRKRLADARTLPVDETDADATAAAVAPRARAVPPCRLDPRDGRLRWNRPCAVALGSIGAVAGVLSGLLGVGGGFVVVPALTRYTDLTARTIVATSMAVLAIVATSGVASAAAHGTVPWPIALPFAAGAMVALLAGRRIAARVPGIRLQQGFAAVAAFVAVLMLGRALGLLGG